MPINFLRVGLFSVFALTSVIWACSEKKELRSLPQDAMVELKTELKSIFDQKSSRPTVIWIDGYFVYRENNRDWYKFRYELLNLIGDGGVIVLNKATNGWEHFWLGHDEPDSKIPLDVLDNQGIFHTEDMYIGDDTAEINPNTKSKIMTRDEIVGYSVWSLTLMKSEIMARYGYVFDDSRVQTFFNTRSWYRAESSTVKLSLSEVEIQNISIINELIRIKSGKAQPGLEKGFR